MLSNPSSPIAILGRGEIKVAITVRVHKVTDGARKKIEAAGGKVEAWDSDAK
jgi:large subunit ribosomal protein L15